MNILIRKAHGLARRISTLCLPHRLADFHRNNDTVAVLIATPTHGNLGDHAIVRAEKAFLSDMGYSVFEIERFQYERVRKQLTGAIALDDLVVIDGGGNVGTLWPEENDKMNDVVERFAFNPVIVFPQTAFFEDSPTGEACRAGVSCSYSKNPNLQFFSRDRATYDVMAEVAPTTRNLYTPDIVLYLNESRGDTARKDALMCLRADKERIADERAHEAIRAALEGCGLAVKETSTVVSEPVRVDASNRDSVLESKWEEFRSAEVVVTDRLHGMIFSAITGTPCVALDNVSHKVSQGYEWIRHIPNIKVAASVD